MPKRCEGDVEPAVKDHTFTKKQMRFWLAGLGILCAVLWSLGDVLLPFVAAMAIAYLLAPVVERIEFLRVPRWLASTVVLVGFLLVLIAVFFLIVPLMRAQIVQLAETLPAYASLLRDELQPILERLLEQMSARDVESLRSAAGTYAGNMVSWFGVVLQSVVTSGWALFDILSLLFITPVVTFYLLKDWKEFVRHIDEWLPRRHADTIRAQLHAVDLTLGGFVYGQAIVCLLLAFYYAIGLSLAGLNFALVVGILAGVLSFIPFVGFFVGFILSVGLALGQFDDIWSIGLVLFVFLVGQFLEGYVLHPRLVGKSTGLHPVWVIFALMAGGALLGPIGVISAVPIAAVIGVLLRFGLERYLESDYYRGGTHDNRTHEI